MLFKFYAAEALKPLSCLITQHLFIFGVPSTEHAETGKFSEETSAHLVRKMCVCAREKT